MPLVDRSFFSALLLVASSSFAQNQYFPYGLPVIEPDLFTTGGGIGSVAFSSDSTMLAASASRGIRIWDMWTGELVSENRAATRHELQFSPNGQLLLAEGEGVKLVEVSTGEMKEIIPGSIWNFHTTGYCFTPDSARVFFGAQSYNDQWTGYFGMVDVASGDMTTTWSLGSWGDEVVDAVLSPDGAHAALVDEASEIRIVSTTDGVVSATIPEADPDGGGPRLAFADSGSLLAVSTFKSVTLFDVSNLPSVTQLWQSDVGGKGVSIDEANSRIVVDPASSISQLPGSSIYFLDLQTGSQTFVREMDTSTVRVVVSPDGELYTLPILQNHQLSLAVMRVADAQTIYNFPGYHPATIAVRESPTSETLILVSQGGGVHELDPQTEETRLLCAPWTKTYPPRCVYLSEDCTAVVFSGEVEGYSVQGVPIKIYSIPDGTLTHEYFIEGRNNVESLALSSDKTMLAYGSDRGMTTILNAQNGAQLALLPHDTTFRAAVTTLHMTPNYCIAGDSYGLVKAWKLDKAEQVLEYRDPLHRAVRWLSLSPDGTKVAINTYNNILVIDMMGEWVSGVSNSQTYGEPSWSRDSRLIAASRGVADVISDRYVRAYSAYAHFALFSRDGTSVYAVASGTAARTTIVAKDPNPKLFSAASLSGRIQDDRNFDTILDPADILYPYP